MIESQLIILQQAKTYLTSVSEQQYIEIISPSFMSAPGAHIRHILDHYYAIINGLETGLIDYDQRSRGGVLESSPQAALESIMEIELFLSELTEQQLQQTLKLSTEISVKSKQVVIVNTTLAREVIFVGSHAVHHFSTIKQISQIQKLKVDSGLGIAPATATFLRTG
ncbi:hypothetical protein E2R68_07860 [Psychromonas sp. RZ22]|uniref:hypothetical protein n=1 Tax=Psychromonas algarum TaxID=2555643 RepID=UPI0010682EC2|nr:hypothetical protein [Psychromonas sp. RZ22]TEW54608.1 hypothetical protein E2R68_07860 [Psychromonas sp. RZ22]